MKTFPYGPVDKETGRRLKLRISGEHLIKMARRTDANGYKGVIQDVKTSAWFRVWAHPCKEDNCRCDAVAVRVEPDAHGIVDPHE